MAITPGPFSPISGLLSGLSQGIQNIQARKADEAKTLRQQFLDLPPDLDIRPEDAKKFSEAGIPASAMVLDPMTGRLRRKPTVAEARVMSQTADEETQRQQRTQVFTAIDEAVKNGEISATDAAVLKADPNAGSAFFNWRAARTRPPAQTETVADQYSGAYRSAAIELGLGSRPKNSLTPEEARQIQKLGNEIVRATPSGEAQSARTIAVLATVPGTQARSDLAQLELGDRKLAEDATSRVQRNNGDPTGQKTLFIDTLNRLIPEKTTRTARQRDINQLASTLTSEGKSPEQAIQAGQRFIKAKLVNWMSPAEKTQYDQRTALLAGLEKARELAEKVNNTPELSNKVGPIAGNIQDWINKATGTKDPTLLSLATELTLALQNYRLGMTGKAFTKSEADEYAAMLPGRILTEKPPLMIDQINNFYAAAARNNNIMWSNRLGLDPQNASNDLTQLGLYQNPMSPAEIQARRRAVAAGGR